MDYLPLLLMLCWHFAVSIWELKNACSTYWENIIIIIIILLYYIIIIIIIIIFIFIKTTYVFKYALLTISY